MGSLYQTGGRSLASDQFDQLRGTNLDSSNQKKGAEIDESEFFSPNAYNNTYYEKSIPIGQNSKTMMTLDQSQEFQSSRLKKKIAKQNKKNIRK